MSISTFIKSKCNQTAVYWGSPVNDGRGKYTFSVCEEIKVRWEDQVENFAKDARSRIQIGKDGREFRTSALLYTGYVPTGGWDLDGFMYLGRLTDLDSDMSPYTTQGAYEIKQVHEIPALNNVNEKIYQLFL